MLTPDAEARALVAQWDKTERITWDESKMLLVKHIADALRAREALGTGRKVAMDDNLTPHERNRFETFRMLRAKAETVPLHVVSEAGKALRSTVGFLCDIIDRLAPKPQED